MNKTSKIFSKIVNAVFNLLLFFGIAAAQAENARVIPLAPSLAEWYCDVQPACVDEIVGVTEYTNFPPELSKKKSIGPYHQVHLETILRLSPTLVLATLDGNSKAQVEQIQKFKIRTLLFDTRKLTDIPAGILRLGKAIDREAFVRTKVTAFEAEIQKLKVLYAGKKKKAAIVIGANPLVVVGGSGFLSEILGVVGLENIYGDIKEPYPRVNIESLLERKPELVVILGMGEGMADAEKISKTLPNVKKALFSGEKLARPTLRLVEGLRELAEKAWGGS